MDRRVKPDDDGNGKWIAGSSPTMTVMGNRLFTGPSFNDSMDNLYKRITDCFSNNQVRWRQHALTRMFERQIGRKDVRKAVLQGEIIEDYANALPFPGCLIFGHSDSRPIHAVLSIDLKNSLVYVVTAYVPDTIHFEADLKTRKKEAL